METRVSNAFESIQQGLKEAIEFAEDNKKRILLELTPWSQYYKN